ncbi:MAG: fumarate reductase/succinate dehydrogenase flavoprotein subunit [Oligoflexia bacterium]|nr:fumarate reductase/succinate dehydrogenase flavoprotein subunit [Oligoflexia bacterium]
MENNTNTNFKLDSKIPSGPIEKKWDQHKFNMKLVNPANKRKYNIIIVGTGLAGASAAASLGELGYNIQVFCLQDSPRRAHSIAAQGGINAAKSYPNDGDSVWRLFYDTVKGGDYRAREANVYRLAQVSNNIIDQCTAQGVPFARDYSGYLANRSFGGAQVSRTFYARGQTGQQLLLGAYQALMRQRNTNKVKLYTRREMLDVVIIDGKARGITGQVEKYVADAVIIASGGYGNSYFLSTNAVCSNGSAIWRAHKRGAFFANPCFTQIHPTCIPMSGEHQSKLTLMSESLRNDGRVWVPAKAGDKRLPHDIPENERDYYLERIYPSFGNLVPRDVASRNAKLQCDAGKGVGNTNLAVYLDFAHAINRDGEDKIRARYGNLFEMITAEDPYKNPMRIYTAVHYTMGGLWVDYNLMSTIPGLFVLGEANFSDHGANRLGASALMQGLADGYFVIPYTIGDYLARMTPFEKVETNHSAFTASEKELTEEARKMMSVGSRGKRTTTDIHRELGKIMWNNVGMSRSEESLKKALTEIPRLREEFWKDVLIPGKSEDLNVELEHALRLRDFLDISELIAKDALERKESCGGHFRQESQTKDNEALRDDENFCNAAVWEHKGEGKAPIRHVEELKFENVHLSQRSYK